MSSRTTSLSILEQARDPHDLAAWRTLTDLYTPLLQTWLTGAGLQPADRDDLTQRVFEVLVRQLPAFQHNGRIGAFRAWLRGIVHNFLKEFWRDRSTPATESVLQELSDPNGRLSRVWDKQHDQHVYQGLAALVRAEVTETTWLAFHRTTLEDQPTKRVAEELGISVNAVLIARSRVLTRLRSLAAELLD
jgi:RNA polymerase sigma-70 factor (ECF subfamily)